MYVRLNLQISFKCGQISYPWYYIYKTDGHTMVALGRGQVEENIYRGNLETQNLKQTDF